MTDNAQREERVPRIVALAYACIPGHGSESGAGWSLARIAARHGETWVVARTAWRTAIEASLAAEPIPRLHFIYVDLPRFLRTRLEGGPLGTRLHYMLWQFRALFAARRLVTEVNADLVWHMTMANGWLGSVGGWLGPPFIYGPVGAGAGMPWRLIGGLGMRAASYEILRSAVRWTFRYLNPIARAAWRNADLILVQNEETKQWLPAHHRPRATVFHHVSVEDGPVAAARPGTRTALFAGRLIAWKGAWLAIRTLVHAPGWRLIICGSGRDEARLRRLTSRLDLSDRVDFRGWVLRGELDRIMLEEADVLLFPSLHDEGGFAVGEALSAGLPVVCVDRAGPPLVAGDGAIALPAEGSVDDLTRVLGTALIGELPEPAAVRRAALNLTVDARAVALTPILPEVLPRGTRSATEMGHSRRPVEGDVPVYDAPGVDSSVDQSETQEPSPIGDEERAAVSLIPSSGSDDPRGIVSSLHGIVDVPEPGGVVIPSRSLRRNLAARGRLAEATRRGRPVIFGIATQALSSLTNLALSILGGRTGGPAGLGVIFVAFSVYLIALGLLRALITEPLVVLSAPRDQKDRDVATRMAVTATIGFGLGAMAVLAIARTVIPSAILQSGIALAIPFMIPLLLQDLWSAVLFRDERGGAAVLNQGLWLLVVILGIPFALAGTEATVWAFWGAGALAGAVLGFGQMRSRPASLKESWSWSREDAWPLGFWMAGDSLLYLLGTHVVLLVITTVVGAAAIGGYRAVESAVAPTSLLIPALTAPGLPRLSILVTQSRAGALRLAGFLSAAVAAGTLLYVAIVVLVGPEALRIVFSDNFVRFSVLIVPMSALALARALTAGPVVFLKAAGMVRELFISKLVHSLVNIVLVPFFAYRSGIVGATWGLAIGTMAGAAMLASYAYRSDKGGLRSAGPPEDHAGR